MRNFPEFQLLDLSLPRLLGFNRILTNGLPHLLGFPVKYLTIALVDVWVFGFRVVGFLRWGDLKLSFSQAQNRYVYTCVYKCFILNNLQGFKILSPLLECYPKARLSNLTVKNLLTLRRMKSGPNGPKYLPAPQINESHNSLRNVWLTPKITARDMKSQNSRTCKTHELLHKDNTNCCTYVAQETIETSVRIIDLHCLTLHVQLPTYWQLHVLVQTFWKGKSYFGGKVLRAFWKVFEGKLLLFISRVTLSPTHHEVLSRLRMEFFLDITSKLLHTLTPAMLRW